MSPRPSSSLKSRNTVVVVDAPTGPEKDEKLIPTLAPHAGVRLRLMKANATRTSLNFT